MARNLLTVHNTNATRWPNHAKHHIRLNPNEPHIDIEVVTKLVATQYKL